MFPGKNGSFTLSAALFQETWPKNTAESTSPDHNSVHQKVAQIHMVSSSRFTRRY